MYVPEGFESERDAATRRGEGLSAARQEELRRHASEHGPDGIPHGLPAYPIQPNAEVVRAGLAHGSQKLATLIGPAGTTGQSAAHGRAQLRGGLAATATAAAVTAARPSVPKPTSVDPVTPARNDSSKGPSF